MIQGHNQYQGTNDCGLEHSALSCTESTNNKRLCEALHGPGNGDLAFDDWKGETKEEERKEKVYKKRFYKDKGAC